MTNHDSDQPIDIDVQIETGASSALPEREPYRIVYLADFGIDDSSTESMPHPPSLIEITSGGVRPVMTEFKPRLQTTLQHPNTNMGLAVEIDATFESVSDFEPSALARRVEVLRPLWSARSVAVDALRGKFKSAELNDRLSQALQDHPDKSSILDLVPKNSPTNDLMTSRKNKAIDALLGHIAIDGGEEQSSASDSASNEKSKLIREMGGIRSDSVRTSARTVLSEIDRLLGLWLNAILSDPIFRSIERTWRGLDCLSRSIDRRNGVRLAMLHSSVEQAGQTLRQVVVDPVFDQGKPAPDLFILDAILENKSPHFEILQDLSDEVASLPAVLLAQVAPNFFGVRFAWQIATLPPLRNMFGEWQFAKWKSLRATPSAELLSVFAGRTLLREPHLMQGDEENLQFVFREQVLGETGFIWSFAPIPAAIAIAKSVSATGWPLALLGNEYDRLPGFATASGGKNGEKIFGPTDFPVSAGRIEEFAAIGVSVAVGHSDESIIQIPGAICAANYNHSGENISADRAIVYKLMATRVANLALTIRDRLSNKPADVIAGQLTRAIESWLPDAWKDSNETSTKLVTCDLKEVGDSGMCKLTISAPQGKLPGDLPITLNI